MSKITIIGDIHGYTKSYQRYLANLDPENLSIQIGDMGLGFSGVGLPALSDNHKFFRGNHDSPAKCRAHKNYLGDFGYLEQHDLFWLSGAFSIDRDMRIEGISWWADEELSYQELQQAIDLYEQTKPKYVLSHETPSKAGKILLADLLGQYFVEKQQCCESRTSQALQNMLDIHQPEKLIFGHYHLDKSFHVPGYKTEFICVGGIMSSGEKPHTYELETNEENKL